MNSTGREPTLVLDTKSPMAVGVKKLDLRLSMKLAKVHDFATEQENNDFNNLQASQLYSFWR